jgi:hypothetical protein
MVTRALFQALFIYVYAWASSPRMPASCASLRMVPSQYQNSFWQVHSSPVRNPVFGWNRRCNKGKTAVQSSLYPLLVSFQAISQRPPMGQELAALCGERHREMILLATG